MTTGASERFLSMAQRASFRARTFIGEGSVQRRAKCGILPPLADEEGIGESAP